MKVIVILTIGYLIGCISPAALLAKRKNVDLKKEGTKNLGATNTALILGKASGIFVMLIDILKSILSAKLTQMLFPQISYAGMLACIGCILGHCFPVFLHFRGGKGLAAFGGMVLAYDPLFFCDDRDSRCDSNDHFEHRCRCPDAGLRYVPDSCCL